MTQAKSTIADGLSELEIALRNDLQQCGICNERDIRIVKSRLLFKKKQPSFNDLAVNNRISRQRVSAIVHNALYSISTPNNGRRTIAAMAHIFHTIRDAEIFDVDSLTHDLECRQLIDEDVSISSILKLWAIFHTGQPPYVVVDKQLEVGTEPGIYVVKKTWLTKKLISVWKRIIEDAEYCIACNSLQLSNSKQVYSRINKIINSVHWFDSWEEKKYQRIYIVQISSRRNKLIRSIRRSFSLSPSLHLSRLVDATQRTIATECKNKSLSPDVIHQYLSGNCKVLKVNSPKTVSCMLEPLALTEVQSVISEILRHFGPLTKDALFSEAIKALGETKRESIKKCIKGSPTVYIEKVNNSREKRYRLLSD
ncbi:hypothetical protein ACPV5V_15895 [Vibrio campbellii]